MESSLSLSLNDLAGEVGVFAGYGRGPAFKDGEWTAAQQAFIDSCVKSGLRNFYFPKPLEGQAGSYDWSFLRPTASVGLLQGATVAVLPDDFGSPEGQAVVRTGSGTRCGVLDFGGLGAVHVRQAQQPTTTGPPQLLAVEPLRGTGALAGQRSRLALWPTADQAYTLQFSYYVHPDALTGALPYPLGGMQHAETILESCLAVAEQRLDDAMTVHKIAFEERLAASISADRRSKPQVLGYNGDRSDGRWQDVRGRYGWPNPVSVNGVTY